MPSLGLPDGVVNQQVLDKTKANMKSKGISLPTFAQLRDPSSIPKEIQDKLKDISPDEPHPLNLYRVHWYNDPKSRSFRSVPYYYELPKSLTGVDAKIVVMIGAWFPMVNCQKVIAAYGCLVPRLITGQFDPESQRAIWPSTGNYCRGGVAISKLMGCRGVAILPEDMSNERFDWLRKWTQDFDKDVVKTFGCESNVKEIYDKCNELDKIDDNIIFNQFSEFGNTCAHYYCTGGALQNVFEDMKKTNPNLKLRGYTGATGSAGTLSSADYLKEQYKTEDNDFSIIAVEALECPTLINNGFGGHNIQGIGDKHVPLVHNVMNTDYIAAVSDQSTDCLSLLFSEPEGKKYLKERKGLTDEDLFNLDQFGYSALANSIAAIKFAKYRELSSDDVVITVATDPAWMYASEMSGFKQKYYSTGNFDQINAAEAYGAHLAGIRTDNLEELTTQGKERIFNLAYYTWVEQQGISVDDFMKRKDQKFWKQLRAKYIPVWEKMIESFNGNESYQSRL